ncbi:MAG: hypothetical protein ACW99A_19470 [Candidatus Kariarchaeaceae archaeon]|jgi:hypothetical protein
MSELPIKINEYELGKIMFEFLNAPTKKQGYAMVTIETRGKDGPRDYLNEYIKPGETYANIGQFYPNGKRCDESETKQGRGTILLNKIIDYLKGREHYIFCYSDKDGMDEFFDKNMFDVVEKNHFIKDIAS